MQLQVSAHVAVLLFIVPQVLTLIAEENTTWTSQVAVSSPASSLDGQTCRDKDHDASSNGTNACPVGYYCRNGTCQCLTAPRGIVSCSEDGLYNYAVLDCYCVTYNLEESLVQAGKCIFNCVNNTKDNIGELYHPLPQNGTILNKTECADMNRIGALCGRCQDNHYPLAYSFSLACVQCHHIHWNWARYIMAVYLPLTLFYLIVLFFKVNVVSGHLHHVVFISQAMSLPALSRILYQSVQKQPAYFISAKVFLSLYGIWNLDFFRPFYSDLCLGIGVLPTLALDYVIAVYPLLLMIISYLLIVLYDRNYRVVSMLFRPFLALFSLFKKNWDIRTSVIDAFTSFFLLSNVKFLSVSFDLLVPTKVYHLHGDHYNITWALYYAGDIEYFGKEHLPYGILAIAVSFIFLILPVAILALYPFGFFQKFLNLFQFRWYILHTFVDSFQGWYKDGTEPGTRDYRYFSIGYILLRYFCFLLYGITLDGTYFPLCGLICLLFTLVLVLTQPYKEAVSHHIKTSRAFLILFTMFYMALYGTGVASLKAYNFIKFFYFVAFVLCLFPLLCILVLMLRSVFLRWRFFLDLGHSIHSLRGGYTAIDEDPEDGYCGRIANPQAYPNTPGRHMENCSSLY